MVNHTFMPRLIILILIVSNGLQLAPPGHFLQVSGAMTLLLLPGLAWYPTLPPTHRLTRLVITLGLSYSLLVFTSLLLLYLQTFPTLLSQIILCNSLTLIGLAFQTAPLLQLTQNLTPTLSYIGEGAKSPPDVRGTKGGSFQTRLIILLILITLGSFFRLYSLGINEFQEDEGEVMVSTAHLIAGDSAALFTNRRKGPVELLLPMNLWAMTETVTESTARLPFALAGCFMLLTLYQLSHRLISPRAALIVLLFATLNGFMVAFARLVQYQVMVMWFSALAFLCLCEWRRDSHFIWLMLAAIFTASGLLSHYDTLLILPALAYLLSQNRPQLRHIVLASGLFLLLIAIFYLPYFLNPQAATTSDYLAGRIGDGLLKNRFVYFMQYNITFTSIYYFLALSPFVLIFFTLTSRWRKPYRLILAALSLALAIQPTLFQLSPTLDFAILPFSILCLGALFAPTLTVNQRALLIWFSVTFIGYNFGIAKPQSHFYTIVTPWLLVASWSIEQLISPYKVSNLIRAGLYPITLAFIILLSRFLQLAYLDPNALLWQQWPNHPVGRFWLPALHANLPPPQFFGFAHQTHWKTIGGLYALGELSGSYYSNESGNLTAWYTLNAPRERQENPPINCHLQPDYFFMADEAMAPPERVDLARLTKHYHSLPRPTGEKGITIYQLNGTENRLTVLDSTFLEATFDQATHPHHFIAAQSQTYPTQANFNNLIALSSYTLKPTYLRPHGQLTVILNWQPLALISTDFNVFVQLWDENRHIIWGESNSQPVCGYYPTSRWQMAQTIPDEHILRLRADTPPGDYQLIVGLQTDNQRLPLLNNTGQPVSDMATLMTLTIKPAP